MDENKKPNTENWGDFSGDFLKAGFVDKFPLKVYVKNLDTTYFDGKPTLNIVFDYEGTEKKIGINKRNRTFMMSKGIKKPKDIKGKILTFEKIRVQNPKGEAVDSFELINIENE